MISTNFRFFRPPPPPKPKKTVEPTEVPDRGIRPILKAKRTPPIETRYSDEIEKCDKKAPESEEIEIRPAIGRKRKISSSSSDDDNLDFLDDNEFGSGLKINQNFAER